jgi:hypothetical protein
MAFKYLPRYEHAILSRQLNSLLLHSSPLVGRGKYGTHTPVDISPTNSPRDFFIQPAFDEAMHVSCMYHSKSCKSCDQSEYVWAKDN